MILFQSNSRLHGDVPDSNNLYRQAIKTLMNNLRTFCDSDNEIKRVIQSVFNRVYFDEDVELIEPRIHTHTGRAEWEVVILLEKRTGLYLGHVRVSNVYTYEVKSEERKTCEMISIRQSFMNAVLRNSKCLQMQKEMRRPLGADRVAHRLLTQVMQICQQQGGDYLYVTEPFGKMPQILKDCNFDREHASYWGRIKDFPFQCLKS